MKKIPLESTIGGSYEFLFKRFLAVLGTVWFPTLVLVALCGGIAYLVIPPGWWHGQFPVLTGRYPDPAAVWAVMRPFVAAYFPLILVFLVMSAMTTVGLMRVALGQRKSHFIFFSLGGDVWRLVGSWLLAFIILMVMYVVFIVAAVIIAAVGGALVPKNAAGWAIAGAVILAIAAFCFWIYAAVRLTFFLPAVVAAEHHIDLARSWELAGGNFWRIVVVCLAVFLPVAIVAGVIQNIVGVSFISGDFLKFAEHPNPDVTALFHAMLPLLPVVIGVQVLQHIALQGLAAGAVAKSYLAVTAPDEVKV